MNDGALELDQDLRLEAAEDEYARALECPSCGMRILGDYSDLDGHLSLDCEAEEQVA